MTAFETRRCVPCEGGIPRIDADSARQICTIFPLWSLGENGDRITRKINCGNFVKAISKLNQIGELAELEQHHPDLHLTGYRHLLIDLTTHAIGGLSDNDFIMAAKIDRLMA